MRCSLNLPANRCSDQRIVQLFLILIAVAIVIFSIGFVFDVQPKSACPSLRNQSTRVAPSGAARVMIYSSSQNEGEL
ncbi:MAG: hypothetical protein QOE77_2000 [Blastocatellia bacterium]|jgi:hypothetical protein|nr:hypothetical protein [Blastocatellia bacterium]